MEDMLVTLGSYTFPMKGGDGSSNLIGIYPVDGITLVKVAVDANEPYFRVTGEGEDSFLLFPYYEEPFPTKVQKYEFDLSVQYAVDDSDELMVGIQHIVMYGKVYVEGRDTDPVVTYVDNLASKVNTTAEVVLHGKNLDDGLSVFISMGEDTYVVPPEDIEYDLDDEGTGTMKFTVYPGMLAMDEGDELCYSYTLTLGYSPFDNTRYPAPGLIRYRYSTDNDNAINTVTSVTGEGACYTPSTMELVYDSYDENGEYVSNPAAGKFGDTLYVRMKPGSDCTKYLYTQVRLKYNKNLYSKSGEKTLDGVSLVDGDVVWLSHQLNEEENGLWVVKIGRWVGFDWGNDNVPSYGPPSCPQNCFAEPTPYPVTDEVLVDLGARVTYQVDLVCSEDVPYKCGTREVCHYTATPGMVLALKNQQAGDDGIWFVTCSEWVKIGELGDMDGTNVDMTRQIVTQNNIDFCKCGGIFYIDYFYMNPSCYLTHRQRTVKIMCAGASIAPNAADKQFILTEYVVRTGEEDSLVGYRGRTPGDPVKEDCIKQEEDFEVENGLNMVETLQDPCEGPCAEPDCDGEIECLTAPDCERICNIPRYYNLEMPADYKNSNDTNGFTIKFWHHERDGWHLYAYIGSGTQLSGMDYYVYHLHVKGVAVEQLVDVNEHQWFAVTTGVLAIGDGRDSFGLVDDTWEFYRVSYDEEGEEVRTPTRVLDDETLYQPWRIKCTTTLMAHRRYIDEDDELRTTCEQMKDAVISERFREDILCGVPNLYGFAYYKKVMTKGEFVNEYNKFNSKCISPDVIEVIGIDDENRVALGTDEDSAFITDKSVKPEV